MALGPVSPDSTEVWYLAQLKAGGFDRAVTNLARQGYKSFMPLREETVQRAGRWETLQKPLFPGYLFVGVTQRNARWQSINATYGVSRLVSLRSGEPTPVDPKIIAALRSRVDENNEWKPHDAFEIGDKVRVVSGPLTDQLAEISSVPAEGRIYVLLELMGQYTKTLLAASQVEKQHVSASATKRRIDPHSPA